MGGESPHADRVRDGPGAAIIFGLGLQSLVPGLWVLISYVANQSIVAGMDQVQFMIRSCIISLPDRYVRDPLPSNPFVGGLAYPESSPIPERFTCIQKSPIAGVDRPMRAVQWNTVPRGPRDTSVGRSDHEATQLGASLVGRQSIAGSSPFVDEFFFGKSTRLTDRCFFSPIENRFKGE